MRSGDVQLLSSVHVPCSFITKTVEDGGLGFMRIEVGSGRIIYANPRFCEMIGYSLFEIIEKKLTFSDLTHPDDIKKSERLFDRLAKGEIDTYAIDKRYVLNDRTILPISGTVAVYDRDVDDRPRIAMAVIRDLSDVAIATENVSGEPQRRGVYYWSQDLRSDRRTCSDGFRSLLGLPPDGPVPTFEEYVSRVHPDDRPRIIEKAERVAKGTLQVGEHRIIRPSGEIRWVSHTVKPIFDSSGAVVEIFGTCLDFTDSRPEEDCSGSTVRIVKDYIEAHWNEPLNVDMLAKAANINSRTLFKHCKRSWGFTPHDYLKSVRLNRARDMLERAEDSATVMGIALKCCFQNQGHFARDYRLAFGERPSETLARRRRLRKSRK
jgi:PAS domain S-box-containing protein